MKHPYARHFKAVMAHIEQPTEAQAWLDRAAAALPAIEQAERDFQAAYDAKWGTSDDA